MTKPPAFQFYADDFLAGTLTMSNEERGLYITLLCIQWNCGFVSGDDVERLGSAMAQPSLSYVKGKFELGEDGQFRNARMEIVRAKQSEFSANRSKSGKEGADKRWHSYGSAIAKPCQKHGSPSPTPSPSPIEREGGAAPAPPRFKKPSVEEMKLQAAKIGLPESEAESAWHFYESKGWKVGSQSMRSWQSALVTWRARWQERGGNNPKSNGHGAPTAWTLTKAIEAKEDLTNALKARHAVETGLSTTWNNEAKRVEFYALRKEIKELKTKLAGMA